MTVAAPDDRGGLGRCGWLTKQLRDAPGDTVIEAYPKNARTPNAAVLSAIADDRYLLLGEGRRDPAKFSIIMAREMGMGRKTGNRSPAFIDSALNLVGDFYGQIVQNVTPWSPPAPKIREPARLNEEPEREAPGVGSDDELEPPRSSLGL